MSAEKASDLLNAGRLVDGYKEAMLDGITLSLGSVRLFLDGVEAQGARSISTEMVRELIDTLELELKDTQ